ncbi:hypothetical protein STAFG_3819 [Streptomyces afghaniensis 772]|uniref:Uncharacterized protein n=1 Tax=Streptomyces afghaniensis 772 TaxID=1283301 RepID=S4MYM6_9ACTN|nr:hypothetical protein STAFG_3819 [Streptomyces afghaniensis 772]
MVEGEDVRCGAVVVEVFQPGNPVLTPSETHQIT